MNENLDLLEILKDAPKGTKLYCTIWGEMGLVSVESLWIECSNSNGIVWSFEPNGKLSASSTENGECVIFPSKEQRDWSKFKLDLPIDTPVMVTDDEIAWVLRYYHIRNRVFSNGLKSANSDGIAKYRYIVPVKDFDFNDPKSNIKKSIC